jgi:biotin carboxylase
VDTHLYPGYTVPSYYDSLLAKLIVWAEDRACAVQRGLRALAELEVGGIHTTAPFHARVLAHPDFQGGSFDTHFIERMNQERHEADKKPVKA